MDIKCKTCRWWLGRHDGPHDLGRGECHGAPPTQRGEEYGRPILDWPRTRGDDFCGLHAPSLASLDGVVVDVIAGEV
jgi:hypothetical protein